MITQWTFSLNVAHFLHHWLEKRVVTNYIIVEIFCWDYSWGVFRMSNDNGLVHYVRKTTCRPWFLFYFPSRFQISASRRLDNSCTHSHPFLFEPEHIFNLIKITKITNRCSESRYRFFSMLLKNSAKFPFTINIIHLNSLKFVSMEFILWRRQRSALLFI